MDKLLYKSVETKDVVILKSGETSKIESWKPFLRQIIICSGAWIYYFMGGLCLGAPTVVIPQLRREANSTEAVTDDMASWLSSIYGLASLPWTIIIPIISGRIGRKKPFFAVSVTSFISFTVFFCSTNAKNILIAEIMLGAMYGYAVTISIIIIAEYTAPYYRGMFLCFQSATGYWGIWLANALGTFFHWRTIAILGMICALYNIVTTLFWVESPSWLAFNGKYEECATSHRWLRGEGEESEKELAALITSCKQNQEKQQERKKRTLRNVLTKLFKTVREKGFYKPLLLAIAVSLTLQTSGKLVCFIYAIDVLKNITASETTAYMGMLLLDGLTIISTYIACVLIKYIKRRTMLMTGSTGGIVLLFTLALYLYLCKLKMIQEDKYIPLVLLSLFSLMLSLGPMILCTTLYGELIPLRYRTAGMFIAGIFVQIVESVTLKTALLMFNAFDMHGTFLFYGISFTCLTLVLYKYLPETKDKTLQEIEEYFLGELKKDNSLELQPLSKNRSSVIV